MFIFVNIFLQKIIINYIIYKNVKTLILSVIVNQIN